MKTENADLILALDVGTQSARAIVFDAQGNMLGRAQCSIQPYVSEHPGWAEQDAEIYWSALQTCCAELWSTSDISPQRVKGLALTTQRATVVCCDEKGTPLRPAIVWLDQRRSDVPPDMGLIWAVLFRAVGAKDLVDKMQAEAECNWIAQHSPALWEKTSKFLLLSGWLSHCLTGEFVDSVGSQVGYLPFDYKKQQWANKSDFKWKVLAIKPAQLPRLIKPGKLLGKVTANAAKCLGVPEGLPVIAAAADKACEVLGCGAMQADTAQLSFGTTATINTTQRKYVEVERMLPAYPAAIPDAWNTEIQIYRGFWMVSWFKREFAHREQTLAKERGVSAESLFDDLIKSVPAGSMGLTLQPYWSPGVRNPGPEAKGAIIGFGDVHTRAHLYRAILEGLIYGLRGGREQIEKTLKHPIRRVLVSGGGSQSDTAMQITADIFNIEVERPEVFETSALGAAICASVGLGMHESFDAAVKAMARTGKVFSPAQSAVEVYDALYKQVYQDLYPRLQPLYKRIRTITGYPA